MLNKSQHEMVRKACEEEGMCLIQVAGLGPMTPAHVMLEVIEASIERLEFFRNRLKDSIKEDTKTT